MEQQTSKYPIPDTGFVVTHFLTVKDVPRSVRFYTEILGGELVFEGEPSFIKLANSWIILNVGGGPTDDKPDVYLHAPDTYKDVSSFLNLRVSNIQHYYKLWKSKGAEFLTEPKVHSREIRCYMKDPDGYLIEVGETTVGKEEIAKQLHS